jgi:hypothetical protein
VQQAVFQADDAQPTQQRLAGGLLLKQVQCKPAAWRHVFGVDVSESSYLQSLDVQQKLTGGTALQQVQRKPASPSDNSRHAVKQFKLVLKIQRAAEACKRPGFLAGAA